MSTYIVNGPQVISEEVGGETVIINLETGTYYNLNEEASKLWALFATGTNLDGIKRSIRPAATGDHLETFFSALVEQALIRTTDASFTPPAEPISVDTAKLVLEVFTDMQDLLGLDPIHEVEESWPAAKQG